MMKARLMQIVLLLFILLFVHSQSPAQDIIQNPEEPLNPDAGRVLELEKVYEIRDDSGEFYFRWAQKFSLDSQDCLYILDEDQILQFSLEGKFVRNIFKKGQGPGEISSPFQMVSYCISGDKLYIYDGLEKIMTLDREGNLVAEVKQTAGRFFELVGKADDGFYFRLQSSAFSSKVGLTELETSIHLVSPDGGTSEKLSGLIHRIYSGPNFGMEWDNYMHRFNPADGSLYATHTCEYKIVRVDLAKGAETIRFNREYPRVKYVMPEHLKRFYERYDPPKKKFENDVAGLFVCGENLWVKTSTQDEEKGILFDVFDSRGRFIDSFYLNVDVELQLADGDCIYVTERDNEENIVIVKYKILNMN